MSSPTASTDSDEPCGESLFIKELTFIQGSGKTRIEVRYDDGHKNIVKDMKDERFIVMLRTTESNAFEKKFATHSLKEFSKFMLDNSVEVTHGLQFWNLLCAGRDCGITASEGVFFVPPQTMEVHGNMSAHPDEFGFYGVHLTAPILCRTGEVLNRIQLRKGKKYIIAGESPGSPEPPESPESPIRALGSVLIKQRRPCECAQCQPLDEPSGSCECVLNPIEVVRDRFGIPIVKSPGSWIKGEKAVVYMDGSGAAVIARYASEMSISTMFCDICRHDAGNIRCRCDGYLFYSRCRNFRYLGMMEPGPKAIIGLTEEFCAVRFRKLARGATRVLNRLNQLMPRGHERVLSFVADMLRCSVEELVYVLNNDLTLMQPISSGTHCFLRRDTRAHVTNRDSLTGRELVRRIFFINSEGRWIMTGLGTGFGVLPLEDGSYHLIEGGPSLQYNDSLANAHFGGNGC